MDYAIRSNYRSVTRFRDPQFHGSAFTRSAVNYFYARWVDSKFFDEKVPLGLQDAFRHVWMVLRGIAKRDQIRNEFRVLQEGFTESFQIADQVLRRGAPITDLVRIRFS